MKALLSFVTAEVFMNDFILDIPSLLESSKCSWKAVPNKLFKKEKKEKKRKKQPMKIMLIKQTLGFKEIRHCLYHP